MALGAAIDEVIRDGRRDVEFAIVGSRDPDVIAAVVDDLCASVLGARVRMYHFYRSSMASVHGVELTDGRSVVVKAHQPRVPPHRIAAVGVVQRSLASDGFPCPRLLAGPMPLGDGTATIEEERVGPWHDGHDPRFRRAMAVTLAELVDRCRGMDVPGIPLDHLLALPTDQLWPHPHSTEFDFEATREGAETIDAAATAARAVLEAAGAPATVIAHTDWRAENMRFDGNRICVVYDWESVKRTSEAMLVGGAGFSFPADWHRPPRGTQAPASWLSTRRRAVRPSRGLIDVSSEPPICSGRPRRVLSCP